MKGEACPLCGTFIQPLAHEDGSRGTVADGLAAHMKVVHPEGAGEQWG